MRLPWEDEEEGQRWTLHVSLFVAQIPYNAVTELIKMALPRSARIQAGNRGANM